MGSNVVEVETLRHDRIRLTDRRCTVVYADFARAGLLHSALRAPVIPVMNRAELASELARSDIRAAFVDWENLWQVGNTRGVPVVAVVDGPNAPTLATTIRLMRSFPWLSHVMHASLLARPKARTHLALLLDKLEGVEQAVLGPSGVGRVACLARASRREARFERIREFFEKHGMSTRTTSALLEVCEELVMNALYDAPLEGGLLDKAVSREEDLELPANRACEISYGIEDDSAFVRVRDTFGALSRGRLLQVLERCSAKAVTLDESRGGAGLGLWRVFSIASTIAIRVVPGKITEVFVGVDMKQGRLQKELVAADLFFTGHFDAAEFACLQQADFDQSITLVA
jgi:hypothetical protein